MSRKKSTFDVTLEIYESGKHEWTAKEVDLFSLRYAIDQYIIDFMEEVPNCYSITGQTDDPSTLRILL